VALGADILPLAEGQKSLPLRKYVTYHHLLLNLGYPMDSFNRVYLSFLPLATLTCINILLLSMSSGFSLTPSPTLNPAEYTSIRIALCLTLSTDDRIFATSSLLRTTDNREGNRYSSRIIFTGSYYPINNTSIWEDEVCMG